VLRAGDCVQVRLERDEGFALTHVRTPPGVVRAIRGTGINADVVIELESGETLTFWASDLELLGPA
jgi:hypothetical protein